MSGEGLHGGGRPDTDVGAARSVTLASSQTDVQVVDDRGTVFLDARSHLDPTKSYLLTVTHRPLIEGISSFTPMGRLHATFWALAYGAGRPPQGAAVRFESGTLRHASSAVSPVRQLAHDCWVADAEGVFSTAALLIDGQERARTRLTQGP